MASALVERFETLITGDRPAARAVVEEAEQTLGRPDAIVSELFGPRTR